MKYLFLSILAVAAVLALPVNASAATATPCIPIYGGGPTCTGAGLSIQKQVLNPKTNLFVHDLGMSDPKYHGNDMVTFQITLTNNSDTAINNIAIKDTFPPELNFKDGPGTYDKNANALTFQVNNLAAHHSEVFTVNTTVISQDQFPANQATFCTGNTVTAIPSTGQIAQDSSQVCVEKITATPSTGPSALALLALLPTTLLGFGLKRLA